MSDSEIIIIGGGLAGLSATVQLASKGKKVLLLEARPRLGGRASSFIDPVTGQMIDVCQHVILGCCTAFLDLCRTLKFDHFLTPHPKLFFLTPDQQKSTWQASRWLPPPLHYTSSFLRSHFLSWKSKRLIARAALTLRKLPKEHDEPLLPWLRSLGQTEECLNHFWSVILVSALNETLDRIGTKYARQVFVDGLFHSAKAGLMYLPNVPLGRLYGEELDAWLSEHKVQVRLNTGVRKIHLHPSDSAIDGIELRNGERLRATKYIVAVSCERFTSLFDSSDLNLYPFLNQAGQLETSPITSVHFWHNRPITRLPHAVLLDRVSQWLFNRGEVAKGEYYTQVVISASRKLQAHSNDRIQSLILNELQEFFPKSKQAKLLRCKVITEHHATYSVRPGVDSLRPTPVTPIQNLLLAGDWTHTDWPATMEGAVRSGIQSALASTLIDDAKY